jgi:hypothetical protein
MSRRSPRARRTPLTCPRRRAAMMVTTEATVMVTATAARATVAVARAAAARPVAKRHWLRY